MPSACPFSSISGIQTPYRNEYKQIANQKPPKIEQLLLAWPQQGAPSIEEVGLTAIPLVAVTFDVNELEEFVLWREMFRGIVAAGMAPLAVHTDAPGVPVEALMRQVDGLIISGGSDVDPARYGGDAADPLIDPAKPARDHNELRMLGAARKHGKPVLAICRGVQLLNVACGGALIADVGRDVPGAVAHRREEEDLIRPLHAVTVQSGSRLAQWMGVAGPLRVNSQHHQGIAVAGAGLRVVARAVDSLIEAVELPDEPVAGVQWHPEVLWHSCVHAMDLMRGFAAECVRARGGPAQGFVCRSTVEGDRCAGADGAFTDH
jgi:putative glutamine amidotransferase